MTRNRTYACAFACTLLVASCALGPNYKRPSLDVPQSYKSEKTETEQPEIARDWWRLFGDDELNTLEQEASEFNQELKAAVARVLEARASASSVKSAFFPVITLDPSVTRTRRLLASGGNGSGGGSNGTSGSGGGSSSGKPTVSTASSSTISSANPGQPSQANTLSITTPNQSITLNGTPGAVSLNNTRRWSSANRSTPSSVTSNLYQIPFDLSYEVDIWGRVRRSYEAARAQTLSAVYDLEVVRQTLLADVAQNYFNLRSLDEQDAILARNVALYEQQVELTQQQLDAGLVSETNVQQAKTLLESTRAQEVDVRRQRADIEHAIAILVGKPPSELSLDIHALEKTPPKIPAGLPADLLRRRPDVAESEQNLAAANAQIGVAVASFFPTLTLTGSAGFESVDIRSLNWESRVWTAGPHLSIPIFEGGKLRANLRQAKAKYEELEATYRGSVLSAFRDVEDSLTDLHFRADAADSQGKAVDAAREYLRLTQRQYDDGIANYLQVIDAERTLLTNELTVAQLLNQRMVSSVLLVKAIGGGWDSQGESAKP